MLFKKILPQIMKVFVYIERMFIKYQSILWYLSSLNYDLVICTQNNDHKLYRLCDTLVIPSSLAMFTFKKIYLKIYWLYLVEVSLNPSPQKKVCKSQNHFYTTLCYEKLIGLVLLSFLVRLIRSLNYCMHYCLEKFLAVKC